MRYRLVQFVALVLIASSTVAGHVASIHAQGVQWDPEEDEYNSIVIGELSGKRARIGETLTFYVASPLAPDPNVRIEASDLPRGAELANLGDGYALFRWTPVTGESGIHEIKFSDVSASLRGVGSSQSVPVLVAAWALTHGFYRSPYDDGIGYRVSKDHTNHNPPGKQDWVSLSYGPSSNIPIVAAADGRIRAIRDDNTQCCADAANGINCSACNNFVWIEHTNGEWTKYSHFVTGTVTGVAGLDTNDCVVQGQLLGYEGDVGHTSGSGGINRLQSPCGSTPLVDTTRRCGIHCHWEVRATSQSSGLRVPILCGVTGGIAYANDTLIGTPCSGSECSTGIVIPSQVITGSSISVVKADISISSRAEYRDSRSTAYFAGDHITLLPGFASRAGTYFNAMIKSCQDGPNGCPPE